MRDTDFFFFNFKFFKIKKKNLANGKPTALKDRQRFDFSGASKVNVKKKEED